VFDKTKLQVQNIQYLVGTQSVGLGQSNSDLSAINSAGEMILQAEIASSSPQVFDPSTKTALVKVTYQVIATDLTQTGVAVTGAFVEVKQDNTLGTITVTPNSFTVANPNITITGSPAVSPTPSCLPPPMCAYDTVACDPPVGTTWCPVTGNTKVQMKLKFQGITKKPRVTTPLNVHVTVTDASSNKVAEQTVGFTSDDNGIWSGVMGMDLPNGVASATDSAALMTYSFYVKGPKHLQKRVCENTPTETAPGTYACLQGNIQLTPGQSNVVDMSGIYQMVGDLPVDNGLQNGVVDSSDTSYIRLHFGETSDAVLQTADLNMDGIIDTQDFSLVIAALNVKYDDPLQ
jgi:hypothetical protein